MVTDSADSGGMNTVHSKLVPVVKPSDLQIVENPAPKVARQSRAEKRRGDKTLPPSPRALWPFALPGLTAEEGDRGGKHDPPRTDLDALITEVRALRPDWAAESVERALTAPRVVDRPWPLRRAAILAVARDPDSHHPGRLTGDGPWWHQPPPRPPAPPWCGRCVQPGRHVTDADGNDLGRCPRCHYSLARPA